MTLVQLPHPAGRRPRSGALLSGARWSTRRRGLDPLPARLADRPVQLPLHLLHARGGHRPHRPRRPAHARGGRDGACRCSPELGVQRVRLTGGEPTVRRGCSSSWSRRWRRSRPSTSSSPPTARAWPRWPRRCARPASRGLTVSLDSLDPERFAAITRRGVLSEVLAGLDAARDVGLRRRSRSTPCAIRGFNDHELGRAGAVGVGARPRAALHRGHADVRRAACTCPAS